jgi:hypothetical protein
METVILASTILGAFEEARSQLIGRSVVLTDGKAGTAENVWLDELHGLPVSIKGHHGKWPVSTHQTCAKLDRFSLIGGSCLEVGVLDPSILKTERPPVTRARSNASTT